MKFHALREVVFLSVVLLPLRLPAAPQTVTFYRDIAPITNGHCVACHRPGEAGPFPLLTYGDVKRRGAQIAAVTQSRYMPPWLPEPGYGHFLGERRLTEAQIQTIQQWVAGGMLEGSPGDAPPAPHFTPGWQLGKPDLVIQAPKSFSMKGDGPDLFWNFVLRSPVDRTRYVKAIEIRPGNARIVHHANLLVDRARTSREREGTPGSGFEGMDLNIESDSFEPDSHFLFWKPGGSPVVEPDGMAWRLDRGDDLVLNVHLQPSGKQEDVQPTIGLYFTEQPQTLFPMLVQLEHDGNLDIPAGARDFQVADDFRLPLDVSVLAIYPHAHYLGKLLEGFATLPDGTKRWLIRIPHWDLNWQAVYTYREPVLLPKGTVISMRYTYDNSEQNPRNPNHPPKRVLGGNQSTDEMGHLWLQVLPSGTGDGRAVLQEALMRHRLEKYPADYSANFNLGALLLSGKQFDPAIAYFRDALQIRPGQAPALNALGAALLESGKQDEALTEFQAALRAQPAYTNARYNLANTLAAEEHWGEAAEAFREVIKEDPEDGRAKEHLFQVLVEEARSLARNNQIPAAIVSLHEAIHLHPADADLHNTLGILLARSGDSSGAIAEFETVLQSDPGNSAAQRNLQVARGQRP